MTSRITVEEIVDHQTRRPLLRANVWTTKGQSSKTCLTVAEARSFQQECERKAATPLREEARSVAQNILRADEREGAYTFDEPESVE